MKSPSQIAADLRSLAAKIERSSKPSKTLVASAIKRVLVAMEETTLVYMSISKPEGMPEEEATSHAKGLLGVPDTNAWEHIDTVSDDTFVGNMEVPASYYDEHEDGDELGPDEFGVSIAWETP